MLRTQGIAYPAIFVKNMQESIMFYRRLGLQPLYMEPNRDDPESVIAMLATGDSSTFIQLVGPAEGAHVELPDHSYGAGSMQYLAFHVPRSLMDEAWVELASAGVKGSDVIDRGYEKLVFIEDPNGALVLLIAWETEPPEGMSLPQILARAARIRDRAGETFVEDRHIRAAIEEMRSAS